MKFVIFFFLSLLTFLLSSCIDGEEEIHINADGSARMKAMYSLPALIFSDEDAASLRELIEREIGKEETVDLLTNTVEKVSGKQIITIEVETADLRNLEKLLSQVDDGHDSGDGGEEGKEKSDLILRALLGDLTYEREGLAVAANRKIDLAPLLDKFAGDRWHSMVGDSEFRYTIHFPEALKSTNAHKLSNDGKSAMWSYKLADSKNGPFELDMLVPIPLPWWVFAGLGLVVLLILLGLWKLISMVKKRA